MSESTSLILPAVLSGIFGIIGTVAGVLLERLLRTGGKVKLRLCDCRFTIDGKQPREPGFSVPSTKFDQSMAHLVFTINFHNPKDEFVGFRDVHVEFNGRPGVVLSKIPGVTKASNVERWDHGLHPILNIPPKQWAAVTFSCQAWGDDLEKLIQAASAHLAYRDEKDRVRRFTLVNNILG